MCSIAGFTWEDKELIRSMNKVMSYRGPDDNGLYLSKNISLGHGRLSIIDLSKAGHQPMFDSNEEIIIVFNGEIYNFQSIRDELEKKGHKFKSNTDTEVIIYAYKEYGYDCVNKFNGMFAFAIYDTRKKEIFLARDRLGVKPLYYHIKETKSKNMKKQLIFASEIKAILEHDDIKIEIDKDSLNSYLTYRFIPSEKTMIKGITKLLPGHYAVWKNGELNIKKYWDLSWKNISNKSVDYYEKELDKLLTESVERRLVGDVPLGAFLSGGLDSSLVVAINKKLRNDRIRTFSVGFGETSDELKYAKKVSNYLDTEHDEVIIKYKDATKELSKIIWLMDEPSSDISMIPLYFLSKEAKKKATIINTGEGADELFSGYYHYRVGSTTTSLIPKTIKNNVYKWYYSPFKKDTRQKLLGDIKEDNTLQKFMTDKNNKRTLNRILAFDIKNEISNWQLPRVDRITMANGIEARVPFLDYKVVEFSTTIPPKFKQNGLTGKYILKKVADKYLPKEIVHRKKQGFTTPMDKWIEDDLNDMIIERLIEKKTGASRFFNKKAVLEIVSKYKKHGTKPFRNYSYQVLMLLFFDIWYDIYVEKVDYKKIKLH
jgi:asparagine synthase (glutamine-hydrolysing)